MQRVRLVLRTVERARPQNGKAQVPRFGLSFLLIAVVKATQVGSGLVEDELASIDYRPSTSTIDSVSTSTPKASTRLSTLRNRV